MCHHDSRARSRGSRQPHRGAAAVLRRHLASCQLLWNSTDDAGFALFLARLSAPGCAALGPLIARFILDVTGEPAPRLRRALPFLFALSFLVIAFDWCTPWVHQGVTRTAWGWTFQFGPLFPAIIAVTVTCFVWGLAVATAAYRASTLESERSQGLWIAAGITQLLVVGAIMDGVLPLLGWPVPQLATTAYALMGIMFAWSLNRFGYSILSPGTFAAQITETMSEGLALLRLDGRVRSVNAGWRACSASPARRWSRGASASSSRCASSSRRRR